jgi:hypothetical protein
MVRIVSSGAEASMSAVRLARGFTRRDVIVKFTGCYRGHVDSLLVQAGSSATTLGVPSSPGVPQRLHRRHAGAELQRRAGAGRRLRPPRRRHRRRHRRADPRQYGAGDSDAATGKELYVLAGSHNGVQCVRFSPDGERLVSSGEAGTIVLWDMTTGQEALRLKDGYRNVWFSADGSQLLSAGWQPTRGVKVWDAGPPAGQ